MILCFQAQHPDELSIVESEQLEVIGEGDGDGWLRARNYKGQEGFVPHNYLDVERDEQVKKDTTMLLIFEIFARTLLSYTPRFHHRFSNGGSSLFLRCIIVYTILY